MKFTIIAVRNFGIYNPCTSPPSMLSYLNTMTCKAAIFDLDGTLLDTLDDIADSCNRVLAQAGFPTHPVPKYKTFVGKGTMHLVKAALPENSRTDNIIKDLESKMKAEYLNHSTEKTKPYPGIIEILTELDARGIIMSILSNKPQDIVEYTVMKLLPHFRFKAVMGANNRFPNKPDPQSTLYIVEQMKTPLEKTTFIGDSDIDILTAKNASITSIAVSWGFRPVDVLTAAGADVIIHKPEELLNFFK